MALSVFVAGLRVHFAAYLMQAPLFIAVGTGDPAWDDQPLPTPEEEDLQKAELSQKTALENCIGVTRVRARSFVIPDDNGAISMSDGTKWSKIDAPTKYLILEAMLDLADAEGVSIREAGIYLGTDINADIPPGQMFIPISDVVDLGTLIQVHRFPPIVRDGSLGQALNPLLEL